MPRIRPHSFVFGTFAALSVATSGFAQDAAQSAADLARPRDPNWVEPGAPAYPDCSAAPTAEATTAAKGAFEAGNAAFNEADYARALLYWEDAFRRDCTASAMLKNLGHAYALDGQYKHAVLSLETYLERGATPSERPGLEERLAELRGLVTREERRLKAVAREKQQKNHPREHSAAETHSQRLPKESQNSSATENASEASFRSPIPLVVAGVGAIALGLGVVKWVGAKQDETNAAEACPSREDCNPSAAKAGNDAVNREITWSIVGGAGAAVLIGGVVWYLVQSPEPSQTARADQTRFFGLQPQLGVGYAGLRWTSAF
jgi:hypothetical protein